MDLEAIPEIPLSNRGDKMIFGRGILIEREFLLCDNMLIEMRDKREAWLDHRPSGSNEAQIQKEWSSLWHTRVPSKVKVFMWRLAKQSIPTNEERQRRHIVHVSCVVHMTRGDMRC
jgi:hypothetical protein